jgi:hypothetical protein
MRPSSSTIARQWAWRLVRDGPKRSIAVAVVIGSYCLYDLDSLPTSSLSWRNEQDWSPNPKRCQPKSRTVLQGDAIMLTIWGNKTHQAIGIDPAMTFRDGSGRPRYLLDEREPVQELQ